MLTTRRRLMSLVNGFQKKILNLGPCIQHWRGWVNHEWALGHCMVGFENSFKIRKWHPDLSITSLKFNLELSNEHWPNLWYRCECTSLLIILKNYHNWIWWLRHTHHWQSTELWESICHSHGSTYPWLWSNRDTWLSTSRLASVKMLKYSS